MATHTAYLTAQQSGTTIKEQTVLLKKDGSMKKYLKNMIITYSNEKNKKSLFFEEFGYAREFINGVNYSSNEVFKYNNEFYKYISSVKFSSFDKDNLDKKIIKIIPKKVNGNIFSLKDYSDINKLTICDIEADKVFSIKYDNGRPYLNISLSNISKDAKSVQYWYVEGNVLKPVIFINLSSNNFVLNSDGKTGNISDKVYISMISNRDTRVYDDNHRIVGEVLNLAGREVPSYVANGQYYGIPDVPQYSMSLSYPIENYTLEITRLKSPYGQMPENKVISVTDTLYYEDVIKIKVTPSMGYYLDTFLINGVEYSNESEIVIKENLSISISMYYPTWHVKQTWVADDTWEDWQPIVNFDAPWSEELPFQYVTTTEEVTNGTQKIRITGTFTYYDNGENKIIDFSNLELNFSRDNSNALILYYGDYSSLYIGMVASGSYHYLFQTYNNIISSLYGISLSITKFEEYY